jgi:hypothetical protein
MDVRPGGPATKRKPSPEGLGINPEDDRAVGAALNLGPHSSLHQQPMCFPSISPKECSTMHINEDTDR